MVKETKSKATKGASKKKEVAKKKPAKKKAPKKTKVEEMQQCIEIEEEKLCSEEPEEKLMSEADPETIEEVEAEGDGKKIPSFTLVRIPQGVFQDIYGRPDIIATRMAWVNKESYHVIKNLIDSEYNGRIIITDIYRKPSESHIARRKKGPMVAPCGLSGHNYGVSLDIDVKGTAKSFGMRPSDMRSEMAKLGFRSISTEDWHYNMGFSPSKSFFYGLYENSPEEFLKHVEEVFVEKFNEICSMGMKSMASIQALLDITADGIFGKKTFLSASMLMAERAGMLDVMNSEKEELVVDFGLLWN